MTKTWLKLDVFRIFGEQILATAEQVEWRAHSRHRKVERVTACYPGFTPVHRADHENFRLYVDIASSLISGHTITWFDHFGKYSFTTDRDQPDAANHVLTYVIDRLLVIGQTIEAALNEQMITMPPYLGPTC